MPSLESGPSSEVSPAMRLNSLFKDDQNDRNSGLSEKDPELFAKRETVRYREAQELYALYERNPELFSGEMKFDLALIFQHGKESVDYQRALELARSSEADGFGGAETLVKATEDRYLLSLGQPQKWGTQAKREEK